jgi:GNAT superfamily N-acetyltransferase
MYLASQLTEPPKGLDILAYFPLTFPRLCPLLQTISIDSETIVIEARNADEVIGLTLAEKSLGAQSARVLSIFTKKEYRGQGVGTSMVACLEEILRQQAIQYVYVLYQEDFSGAFAVEKIADRMRWSGPELHMVMVKGSRQAMREPHLQWIFQGHPLADGFEIFPWRELSDGEREAIIKRQEAELWYPEMLSPFREESIMEPINSLGLRYFGEVIGWMINHRITPDTIRYTPLFVSEEARNSSAGYMLIIEAVRRQWDSEIPNYLFLFEPQSPIRKWVLRRFGEAAVIRNIMKSYKNLAVG